MIRSIVPDLIFEISRHLPCKSIEILKRVSLDWEERIEDSWTTLLLERHPQLNCAVKSNSCSKATLKVLEYCSKTPSLRKIREQCAQIGDYPEILDYINQKAGFKIWEAKIPMVPSRDRPSLDDGWKILIRYGRWKCIDYLWKEGWTVATIYYAVIYIGEVNSLIESKIQEYIDIYSESQFLGCLFISVGEHQLPGFFIQYLIKKHRKVLNPSWVKKIESTL